MSPKLLRSIFQIVPFGIIFFIAGFAYALIEKGLLGDLEFYPVTGVPYKFEVSLYFTFSMAGNGILVGIMEVFFLKKLFTNRSFIQKILLKTMVYVLFNFTLTLIFYPVATSINLHTSVLDPAVWSKFLIFITGYAYISLEVFVACTLMVSLFYAEISEHVGQPVLKNFFTGKYHLPIEEERIFMFLDMNESTTIAEKLGHLRYFEMVAEYFSDLSKPVLKHAGEVYQYVGDELIVSWPLKKGLSNSNCINCYYAMTEEMAKQSNKYTKKYGLVPKFKVGLHCGKVTAGEIGVLKKEIVFTGDVLNATARIQGLCKDYKVDVLISEDLKQVIGEGIELKSMGENELRGRKEKMVLYTV